MEKCLFPILILCRIQSIQQSRCFIVPRRRQQEHWLLLVRCTEICSAITDFPFSYHYRVSSWYVRFCVFPAVFSTRFSQPLWPLLSQLLVSRRISHHLSPHSSIFHLAIVGNFGVGKCVLTLLLSSTFKVYCVCYTFGSKNPTRTICIVCCAERFHIRRASSIFAWMAKMHRVEDDAPALGMGQGDSINSNVICDECIVICLSRILLLTSKTLRRPKLMVFGCAQFFWCHHSERSYIIG